jgi:very-short-patch-repair endonuclease
MSTHAAPSLAAYAKVPPSERVLVALLKNPRDLVIAREEHWYRIPVKSAPRPLDVAYIGFYQGNAFKDEKWAVRYFCEVQSCAVLKRRHLLPGEPHHPNADAEYFKLQLGELQTLKKPILSKRGRRLVFVPTTLEKFERAEELNDLFHDSPLEDGLWSEFKRRGLAAERQLFITINKARYCLDFALFCRVGQINIECDGDSWHSRREAIASDNTRDNALTSHGWAVLRFNTIQLRNDLSQCLESIRRTILRNGGPTEENLDRFFKDESRAQLSPL